MVAENSILLSVLTSALEYRLPIQFYWLMFHRVFETLLPSRVRFSSGIWVRSYRSAYHTCTTGGALIFVGDAVDQPHTR